MEGLKINQKSFGDYYDKPDWWFKIRYDTQYKKNTCLQMLKKNNIIPIKNKILEIGFGCGETLLSFHKSELHGLEISNSAINFVMKRAQKIKIKNIHLQINTKNILPYPDNSFNLVIASHVIEHVEDHSLFVDEINRVLYSIDEGDIYGKRKLIFNKHDWCKGNIDLNIFKKAIDDLLSNKDYKKKKIHNLLIELGFSKYCNEFDNRFDNYETIVLNEIS